MQAIALFIVLMIVFSICEAHRNKVLARRGQFTPARVLGDAGFATEKDLKKAGYFRPGGIRIGFSPNGKHPIFYNGFGHLLLVAGARMGKAFTVIVSTILSLGKRPLIVFDPKAELTCITAFFRRLLGRVIVLNPFGTWASRMVGLTMGCYNPMDLLDPDAPDFHIMCDKLADCFRPEKSNADPHWWDTGAQAISATIAALKKYGHVEDQNLIAVRSVLTGANGKSFFAFARECMELPDEFIRQGLARFAEPGAEESKEFTSVLSTVATRTGWMANGTMATFLGSSNFRFRDLKREAGMTIYICLPLNTLDVSFPFFAMMMMCILWELLDEGITGPSVLAIVDEAAQIPYFKAWEDAWGMAAGAAGLQLFAVYQGIEQVMRQMGNSSWQTVIQNCGATIWFGAKDHITRQTISDLAGVTEVLTESRGQGINHRTGEPEFSFNLSQTQRPLLHPDDVGRLRDDEMVVFCEGVPAVVRARRYPYLTEFKGKYRDNPYFRKPRGFWNS